MLNHDIFLSSLFLMVTPALASYIITEIKTLYLFLKLTYSLLDLIALQGKKEYFWVVKVNYSLPYI